MNLPLFTYKQSKEKQQKFLLTKSCHSYVTMIMFLIFFICHAIIFLFFLYAIFQYSSFEPENSVVFRFFFNRLPSFFPKLFTPNSIRENNKENRDNCDQELFLKLQELIKKIFNIDSPTCYIGILFYYIIYHFIAVMFLLRVFPFFPFILENPEFHHMFVFIVLLLPWIIVLIIQFVDPGNITQENVDDYLKVYLNNNNKNSNENDVNQTNDNDENKKNSKNETSNESKLNNYDQLQLSKCAKLHIPAVPRSRFCPFAKKRIAKYDHYCLWVMQPIGEKNIRLYLLFLLSNFLATIYFFVISEIFLIWKLKYSSNIEWSKYFLAEKITFSCYYLLKNEVVVCGISIFFVIFITIILSLIIREIYLISINLTLDEIMARKAENQKKIINEYDKGILQNWLEVLFPSIL